MTKLGADKKKLGQAITEAVAILPEAKREFILGYAEGVIAMASRLRQETGQNSA